MLRRMVGSDRFWSGLGEYYRRYRDGHATTADFRRVMERMSGQDLEWFFDQWLRRPGVPKVEGSWRYDLASRKLVVELRQVGPGEPFRMSLDLGLSLKGGATRLETVELRERSGRFDLAVAEPPSRVVLDPDTWTLVELGTFERR
jgi:aminopeptidase N